ncbi:MAG: energy-coupling factor transporter transmembrane protein EcfT [Clostridia bacterium]|nr:energy-coupling factor transporter transmembrane protein EcfT [Clostridia bacterium]
MKSGFRGCHPAVNISFFISVLVFGMLLRHPVTLVIAVFASLAYYIRLSGRYAARTFFRFLLPMLIIVTALNLLTNHYGVTELFILPSGNRATLESAAAGLVTGIMMVSTILWFFCWNEVVTEDKFMSVFGRIFPVPALIIMMALRFVPLYRRRLHEISDAQTGIGRSRRTGNIFERIRRAGSIIQILINWSLESAVETSDSMRSRGYGLRGRTGYSRYRMTGFDAAALIFIAAADIMIALGVSALGCLYNPRIIINPDVSSGTVYLISGVNATVNPLSALGAAAAAAYAVLCFMPLIMDLKEGVKWRSLK